MWKPPETPAEDSHKLDAFFESVRKHNEQRSLPIFTYQDRTFIKTKCDFIKNWLSAISYRSLFSLSINDKPYLAWQHGERLG